MKRILSTALAIVLFIGAAQAQDTTKHRGHRGEKHGGEMFKELNLTEDQKAKMKSIREAQKAEMKSLKADGKSEEDKDARKALHEKYKTQIDAVLTSEQKAKLDQRKDDWKEKGKAGKLDGFGKGQKGDKKDRMKEFGKELNLTTDQQAKVKSINEDFKGKMETLRKNSTLSQEEKREQVKKLAESHKTSLKAVLTQEQIAKMEEARKKHGEKRSKNL
jgi:Spy/CpxP family protein refolding chaperone